jgi:hypothetical protein
MPVPLFLKQCYTVWVGICVAYIFTHVPEWTSWVLLVIMALYDLAAVLLPGGPLKVCTVACCSCDIRSPGMHLWSPWPCMTLQLCCFWGGGGAVKVCQSFCCAAFGQPNVHSPQECMHVGVQLCMKQTRGTLL